MTSKHDDHFYCLNCLHSFRTENKLRSHEKYVKIKTLLEFNQRMKSDEMPYIIYANIEFLISKID